MDSKIWGPSFWLVLHSIAVNYPDSPTEADKKNHEAFFTLLQYVLPCGICREHFKQQLQGSDLQESLVSKTKLFEWVVRIHNHVNRLQRKPDLSYNRAVDLYYKLYSETSARWWYYACYFSKTISAWAVASTVLLLIACAIIVSGKTLSKWWRTV
jgi:hypothetical protein